MLGLETPYLQLGFGYFKSLVFFFFYKGTFVYAICTMEAKGTELIPKREMMRFFTRFSMNFWQQTRTHLCSQRALRKAGTRENLFTLFVIVYLTLQTYLSEETLRKNHHLRSIEVCNLYSLMMLQEIHARIHMTKQKLNVKWQALS